MMKKAAVGLAILLLPAFLMANTLTIPDIGDDGKVGLGEVVHILQILTGVREEVSISAVNQSTETLCAEDDNINIPLSGDVERFLIEATHPGYDFDQDDCAANFENCPTGAEGYSFAPNVYKLFDDGLTVVEAVREAFWWRPRGMSFSVDSDSPVADIHYLRISKKIAGADEWPQVLVLYMDGNCRLIPHPPQGRTRVCFGSSVIIGPASVDSRPIAEIESARYDSSRDAVEVTYVSGGTAAIHLESVDRTHTRISVDVAYLDLHPNTPFATFRSMYVAEDNADAALVRWRTSAGIDMTEPIMDFSSGIGHEWYFFRNVVSNHNISAPAIRIFVE